MTRRITGTLSPQVSSDQPITRFEVCDRARRIACAVTDDALENIGNLSLPSTDMLRRRSFDRFRTVIDAAARLKLATLPTTFLGPMLLSMEDLCKVPAQAGRPQVGSLSWSLLHSP